MKITGRPQSTDTSANTEALASTAGTDLKYCRKAAVTGRRTRNPSLTRLKRPGAPPGKRSRPETPLLKWKIEDRNKDRNNEGLVGGDKDEVDEVDEERETAARRRSRRKNTDMVSARKLVAGLWRLQLPETVVHGGGGEKKERETERDRLGFQSSAAKANFPFLYHYHCSEQVYGFEEHDQLRSPSFVAVPKKGHLYKHEPSIQFSNSAMEGATKWDPVCVKKKEVHQMDSRKKRIEQQVSAVSVVSALEAELEQARTRVEELETERRSQKKKLEHFLRKVSEERAAWRSREHEKVRAFIDDVKADLNREKKNRQRLEIVNSKLVNELADAKSLAKRYMQDYEKERKTRELIEEVCNELASEIGEDKAEGESMKRECIKLREEVDDERKMLQMAEVWREERVQMKLVDAKVAVEEKYTQMNKLVAELEAFLKSKSASTPDVNAMREAELLRQASALVDIQSVKEFTYVPPNPDDIFSIFEDVNHGEREIEQFDAHSPASQVHRMSPKFSESNKDGNHKHSNAYIDQVGDIEDEDESGWETVSHLEDQGSSFSPEGSIASVNKNCRVSNVSGSGTEWEENGTPTSEVSEVCSAPRRASKVSSIAKLWKSGQNNGENFKIISVDKMNSRVSNGRKSNVSAMSPDRGSGKGGLSPMDLLEEWRSPDSHNSHVPRGMKGCIEWPRGAQRNSLKAKLFEARMESQKVQIRHVLKQKI